MCSDNTKIIRRDNCTFQSNLCNSTKCFRFEKTTNNPTADLCVLRRWPYFSQLSSESTHKFYFVASVTQSRTVPFTLMDSWLYLPIIIQGTLRNGTNKFRSLFTFRRLLARSALLGDDTLRVVWAGDSRSRHIRGSLRRGPYQDSQNLPCHHIRDGTVFLLRSSECLSYVCGNGPTTARPSLVDINAVASVAFCPVLDNPPKWVSLFLYWWFSPP